LKEVRASRPQTPISENNVEIESAKKDHKIEFLNPKENVETQTNFIVSCERA
jgi:hypothetical protein